MKIYYQTNDEIYHYGVPGMKWGVRKKGSSSQISTKAARKKLEKEYGDLENKMTYGKKADPKKNAQIQKKMSSIEKKLDDLSKRERAEKLEKGKNALSKISSSLAFIGTAYGTRSLGYGMGTSLAVGAIAKGKVKSRQKLYEEFRK